MGSNGEPRRRAQHLEDDPVPDPDEQIGQLWVLVAIHPNGGEGIYGQTIQPSGVPVPMMVQFVASMDGMKEKLEGLLRKDDIREAAAEEGIKLEWRLFEPTGQSHAAGEEAPSA